MNLKKTPFAVPVFMIQKSGFVATLNVSKYPKLHQRVCDLANKEKMSGNAIIEKLLQEEFQKMEQRIKNGEKMEKG